MASKLGVLEEVLKTTEQYIRELKTSGYSQKQARELICRGIRGWKAKHKRRMDNNRPFYRLAETTVESRMKKDLLEREMWYKSKQEEEQGQQGKTTVPEKSKQPLPWKRSGKGKRLKRLGDNKELKSIIFIPHIRDSKLATILRERETKLAETTGDRVKVVERSGRKIEDLITNKDPWKNKDCQRPNCFICNTKTITGKGLNIDCTKRNFNYTIKCLNCEEEERHRIDEVAGDNNELKRQLEDNMSTPIYIGETSRSGYERDYEHLNNLTTLSSKSVILNICCPNMRIQTCPR